MAIEMPRLGSFPPLREVARKYSVAFYRLRPDGKELPPLSGALMRMPRAVALAIALCSVAAGEADAFTASIVRGDKVLAYRAGGGASAPYAGRLSDELLSEIRRTALPFSTTTIVAVLVKFAVNRRGEVLSVATFPKSSPKIIQDYAEMIVRNASRRFPPPPADTPSDTLLFALPLRFR